MIYVQRSRRGWDLVNAAAARMTRVFKPEWRKREPAICAGCERPFMAISSELKRGKGRLCSHACAAREAGHKDQAGTLNPNWKGGVDRATKGRQYRAKFPDRNRAHRAVRNAIRRGRLTRLPCERCGNTKSEAHHDDYGKSLAVRWLCKSCHMDYHYQEAASSTEGRAMRGRPADTRRTMVRDSPLKQASLYQARPAAPDLGVPTESASGVDGHARSPLSGAVGRPHTGVERLSVVVG